ncbi:hypothetical protein HYT57_01105 [Candidatus Woesearchaeota archaeon]|nr:hypothetical protein [Candidatus Woesearchaeota archaeon]
MNKYIVLSILILIVFLAGCNHNPVNPPDDSYKPSMELTLNKDLINVRSDTTSETIIITLIKKDSKKVQSSFIIELISPEKEFIYFVDDANKPIDKINTTLFEHVEDRQLYDFKVYAKKDPQKDSVEYTLNFKLLYNGEGIGTMPNLKARVI